MSPAPLLAVISRDEHDNPPDNNKSGGLHGWAVFLIVILVVAALCGAAYFAFITFRRRPSSSSSSSAAAAGPSNPFSNSPLESFRAWASNTVYKIKNRRSRNAGAGYEPSGISAGRTRGGAGGRTALDPDEAWDARVGQEAEYGPFYEDTELQSHTTNYSGAGYGGGAAAVAGRQVTGITHSEGEPAGADGRGRVPRENPFSDDNAVSLRAVSPRPLDTKAAADENKTVENSHSSSTADRRSLFREDV